jgi:hypothetical protein
MYTPRIQILNIKAFENELREKGYIMVYIFYDCPVEVPTYVPRGRSKERFRRKLRKATIYIMSTLESALPIKYSEYADVFSENEINNVPPVARIDYAINFEKNLIIFYKSIYYFSERELIVLK